MQPGTVTGLKAQLQDGNIRVSWNKNRDVDLLGYNIFLNNEWVGTVDKNAVSFIISREKVNKIKTRPLEVAIEAFDYDGEASQKRAKVTL